MTSVTLSQVSSLPDILGSSRHVLKFGPIPGADDDGNYSIGSAGLTYKRAEVTIPQIQIGQVRVPLLGFPRAFRGSMDHQNRFTAVFFEDVNGGTTQTMFAWLKSVRSFDDGTGGAQSDYTVNARLEVYDTTGKMAFGLALDNVWPTAVTPSQSSEAEEPVRIAVDFSVDFIDLLGQDNQSSGNSGYSYSGDYSNAGGYAGYMSNDFNLLNSALNALGG